MLYIWLRMCFVERWCMFYDYYLAEASIGLDSQIEETIQYIDQI